MESLVSWLMSMAIFLAILYSIARAILGPIHAKLDRILALQERGLSASESLEARAPAVTTSEPSSR